MRAKKVKTLLPGILLAGVLLMPLPVRAAGTGSGVTESVPAEETASKKEIQVISIIGNELTYSESGTESREGGPGGDGSPQSGAEMPEMPEMPETREGGPGGGGSPESGAEMPEMPVRREGGPGQENGLGAATGRPSSGRSGARETKTVYLPVPVVVHAADGETYTFAILKAGDQLEVTTEEADGEEIITEIWMKDSGDESS